MTCVHCNSADWLPFLSLHRRILLPALCVLMAGCVGGQEYDTVTSEDADRAEAHADHDHHHHHEAPHGGHLIELGDHKYNAEVLLEGDPKQLVVYVFDAHAENAVAIDSPSITFALEEGEPIVLAAQPQEGDAEGKASKFAAAETSLTDLEALHGSVKVTIEGTEYVGELSHDHDHDHDHAHGEQAGKDHDHAE
jgi:hypothetical protein